LLLENYVADLYLVDMGEILASVQTTDPAQLGPLYQRQLKRCLDCALSLNPEAKLQVKQVYPGVIEFFYLEPAPKPEWDKPAKSKAPTDAGKKADSAKSDVAPQAPTK
jgi:hypothetical protein